MPHRYRVTLTPLEAQDSAREPDAPLPETVSFEITNHDEITALITRMEGKAMVPQSEAAEFIVGLKLFSEVLIRHRAEPIFAELAPHFRSFMKALKASPARETA